MSETYTPTEAEMDNAHNSLTDDQWRQSSERELNSKLESATKVLDAQMSILDQLDFSDIDKLITWLDKTIPALAHRDVGSKEVRERILNEFQKHGYQSGANTGSEFNKENKQNRIA